MTITYTVTLSDAENLALGVVSLSQQDWIDNAVHERCRIAIADIVAISLEKSIETGTTLPTSKEQIVLLAIKQGWVHLAGQSLRQ